MQNKNETNENVSRVVADFFKKNPIKHNNSNKRRASFRDNALAKGDADKDDKSVQTSSENDSSDNSEQHKQNKFSHNKNKRRHHDKNYKKNQPNEIIADNTEIVNEQNSLPESDANIVENNDKASTKISDNEWYDPSTPVEIVGVRFKTGGKIYYFSPMGITLSKNDSVIVETARGLEFGTVHTPNSIVQIKEVVMPLKNVVRIATDDDIRHYNENNEKVKEAIKICNERIAVHNLDMKLVDVEYTFDNSKLLFYFTSEGRVDFRELVKDLASIFKTRIELRQIGIREETKLLGGIGICGRPFCCKSFLNDFVQVSIKMAKEQGLSLNSAKISGACGRLMCCLRYEYDTYDEEIRKTPKIDTRVITPDGPGVVCETQPLAGLCKVRISDGEDSVIKVYHRDDLKHDSADDKKASIKPENDNE